MRCAVYGCHSDNQSKAFSHDVRFFTFPKDQRMIHEWTRLCRREDKFNVLNSRICSKHFKNDDYVRNLQHELLGYRPKNVRLLKKEAVPSENLPRSGKRVQQGLAYTKTTCYSKRQRKKLLTDEIATAIPETARCRLCLKTTTSDFEVLDEMIQCNLNFILLQLDVTISDTPIICLACAERVKDCLDFKAKCIVIEDRISALGPSRNNVKLNLRDVYTSKGVKSASDSENYNVCRLCMEIVKRGFTLLDDLLDTGMLYQYFPELNFNVVDQPVVCMSCYISLQRHLSFIKKCLRIEERIMEYRKVEDVNCKERVDLNSVAKFMCKMDNGLDEVKTEETCIGVDVVKIEPTD